MNSINLGIGIGVPFAYNPLAYLLSQLGAVRLIDKEYIHPSIASSRTGPGMTQDAAGDWVWWKHNYFQYTNDLTRSDWWSPNGNLVVTADVNNGAFTAVKATTTTNAVMRRALHVIVVPLATYTVTWWAKSGTAADMRYRIYNNTAAKDIIPVTSYLNKVNPNGYTRISVTFTVPAGCTAVYAYCLYNEALPGTCYLSQPQFQRGNTALDDVVTGATAVFPLRYNEYERGYMLYGQTTNLYPNNSIGNASASMTVTAQAYTLSMIGTGSVTLSGTYSGTLTGTGGNNRVTLTFTPTAGTLVVTPTSTAQLTQLETSTTASPPIPTYGASAVCSADPTTIPLAATGLTDAAGCVVARVSNRSIANNGCILGGVGTFLSAVSVTTFSGFISDGTTLTSSELPVFNNALQHTLVTSWGVSTTCLTENTVEGVGAYDGTIVASTLYIGNRSDGTRRFNGIISELWTIPTQPDAETRAKLARLWA